MLPEFYDGNFLPPGDHSASWAEVVGRFGGNSTRTAFCNRLLRFLRQAKRCGFLRVYLFGSFISAKDEPGDVDLLWVHTQNIDIDRLSRECRDLLNYETMKARENWDMWCCSDDPFVVNYLMDVWRRDKAAEQKPRGVIILDLGTI
jgi:hypothetical protein